MEREFAVIINGKAEDVLIVCTCFLYLLLSSQISDKMFMRWYSQRREKTRMDVLLSRSRKQRQCSAFEMYKDEFFRYNAMARKVIGLIFILY